MTQVVSFLNLIGSFCSFIGSGFILLCYLILPRRNHFRHVLIINLATADFLDSLNNSMSGFYLVITKHSLSPGPACTANGFFGQIAVQGTDCTVLAIAIITVYVITRGQTLHPAKSKWAWDQIISVTGAIWALPITTSFTALGKGWYGPVSGSWCWLVTQPAFIRYVLTHGWRCLFIFLEIGLYTYLHIYLKEHYRELSAVMDNPQNVIQNQVSTDGLTSSVNDPERGQQSAPVPASTYRLHWKWSHMLFFRRKNISDNSANDSFTNPMKLHTRHKHIERVLLLNLYPIGYIFLWIPGLINRLIEASGNKSAVAQIIQSSTQFVGLANALTYGWNENIAKQIRKRISRNPKCASGVNGVFEEDEI